MTNINPDQWAKTKNRPPHLCVKKKEKEKKKREPYNKLKQLRVNIIINLWEGELITDLSWKGIFFFHLCFFRRQSQEEKKKLEYVLSK